MRVVERLADLGDDHARLREGHLLALLAEALQHLPQVAAGDVLHRDVEVLVVLAELEHLDDVRVRQLHRDPRLVHEHVDELGVLAHGGQDLLDRQQALEAFHAERLGDEHLCHPAHGNALEEKIVPESDGLLHGGEAPERSATGAERAR